MTKLASVEYFGRWEVVEQENSPLAANQPAFSDAPEGEDEPSLHVIPHNDLFPHVLSLKECWCHPELDEEEQIVVHNSADGREHYEDKARSWH